MPAQWKFIFKLPRHFSSTGSRDSSATARMRAGASSAQLWAKLRGTSPQFVVMVITGCFSLLILLAAGAGVLPVRAASVAEPKHSILLSERSSAGDLEIGGELAALPPGSVRYVRYEDLLTLPQETYNISDDPNFHGPTEISGIPLTSLARLLGQAAHSDLIVAICYDKYRSNYPSQYLAHHHPLLVLKVNGQLRDKWPPSEHGGPLGPYLISHPAFKPDFSVLSHKDEMQIPFGVTRLDFRTESIVYGAIRPAGEWAQDSPVWQGYRIAREDCYRCHRMGNEGGELAGRSWLILSAWAATDAQRFALYIRNPRSIVPSSKMEAHGGYDDSTLRALTAYFKTFTHTGAAQ